MIRLTSFRVALRALVIMVGTTAYVAGAALPAAAQTPTAEVSVAYQALRIDDVHFNIGGNIDLAVNAGDVLSIVGEAGGVHRSEQTAGATITTDIYNFAGGPRINLRTSVVSLFAQMLGGVVRTQSAISATDFNIDASQIRWMVQPGVGTTLAVSDSISIVGQLDYRRVFLQESTDGGKDHDDEFRFLVGIRFGF